MTPPKRGKGRPQKPPSKMLIYGFRVPVEHEEQIKKDVEPEAAKLKAAVLKSLKRLERNAQP